MKFSSVRFKAELLLLGVLCLGMVWLTAWYGIDRSYRNQISEAEIRTAAQAQVFSEYSRAVIKRTDEFILDIRSRWTGDWQAFSEVVTKTKENIDDLTFQVGVINKDGFLAFSNLATAVERVDLSAREHFKVHKDAGNADRLFISKPLMGKVSGRLSIQLTRPIIKNGQFDGVVVISISPEQFTTFAEKMLRGQDATGAVVRNTGDLMAVAQVYSDYSRVGDASGSVMLRDFPFLKPNVPISRNYRQVVTAGSQETVFGVHALSEYGLYFLVGESLSDILAAHVSYRDNVLSVGLIVSLLVIALFHLIFRSLLLRETNREQLNAIFELCPDGFVSFDRHRCVKYFSPAFIYLTGLPRRNLIGMSEAKFSDELARVCTESARFPGIAVLRESRFFQSGSEAPEFTQIEIAGDRKCVLKCAVRFSDDASLSQVLYIREVTHETEVERLKSEFLITAAHELRTPMTTIYGFAELLLERDFDEDVRLDLLATIVRQSKLTIDILNELLDLSRIEARRGKDFQFERVDLAEFTDDVVGRQRTPEGFAPLFLSPTFDPFWVQIDRKKIIQAVSNVLSNAYKYSEPGSVVAVDLIRTEAHEDARSLTGIRIADHGIGLTAAQRARVGERFYRADRSGKIPGTGLGLSLVREIMQAHGGSMDIESELGTGTTVTLWFKTDTDATPVDFVKSDE